MKKTLVIIKNLTVIIPLIQGIIRQIKATRKHLKTVKLANVRYRIIENEETRT